MLYDTLSNVVTNSELIREGYLLPTKVFAPSEPDVDGVTLGKCPKSGEDFNQAELSRRVQDCTTFANIWDEWEPFKERKTIVFAPTRDYCAALRDAFEQRIGDGCYVIDCDTKLDDRREIMREMKGDGRVLLSVDVLREGFDSPEVSCAIDLQPTQSLRVHVQKLGRIKRPFEGQTHAVLIDMSGNVWRNCYHPDEDPEWPTGKETCRDVVEKKRAEKQLKVCPNCRSAFMKGRKCPECGHEAFVPVRRIRMGDGTLKEIKAQYVKKHREVSTVQKEWDRATARAVYAGLTVRQALGLYKSQTGEWPPREGIKPLPEREIYDELAKDVWPWKDRRRA